MLGKIEKALRIIFKMPPLKLVNDPPSLSCVCGSRGIHAWSHKKSPFGLFIFSEEWLPLAHILRTKYFQEIIEMGRDFSQFWKVQNAHRAN